MTKQSTQKVSAKRMDALNQRVGPFAEERAHYIEHLRKRGWALATLCGTASNLNAFADRVDIDSEGGVTLAQVEAAALSASNLHSVKCYRINTGEHRFKRAKLYFLLI